ncbi:FG-GAP-like repeat-containing protein [Adhaeribacter pallidiroseus]|uniref:FG-GAP-like repeat-containing protein n=1 Tax=Adhaeribacter pallidiroseus TaxID=2072847 RepID=UPI001314351E|nr:FG-GAP-like repeat-containing protein [Adhaeribacter pallidiroseus]
MQRKNLEFTPLPDSFAQFEWLDADGDKDLDALVFNQNNWENKKESVRLYENRNGKFIEVMNPFGAPVDLTPLSYIFGDYDQDGDIDFLIQDFNRLRVARNSNRLSFTLQDLPEISTNSSKPILHWLDIDSDADLDIITTDPTSFAPVVYLNQQNTFTQAPHPLSASLQSFAFADVNNDGLPDFAGAKGHTNSNPIFLHINRGDGLFEVINQELLSKFADYGKMLWSDLDGDRDLDLFLITDYGRCIILRNLFIQTGQPNFENAYQITDFLFPKVDIGDINQDGLPDLICTGEVASQPKTVIYLNQSNKTSIQFEQKDLNIPATARHLDLVDLNQDQALDLFYISSSTYNQEPQFESYQNSAVKPGFKLPVPTKLQSDQKQNVLLSWDPIKAPGTISYNLELKLNNKLYKSSLSLPDGRSLWPQNPHKQILNKLELKHLPAGNYQWRLQAVDAAGRNSAFSTYQSFTVAPGPTNLVFKQPALTRVQLRWAYQGDSSQKVIIFRRSANMPLQQIATLPATIIFFEDSSIFTNRTYDYVVKVEQGGVLSAPSNQVQVNTKQFVKKTFPAPRPRAVPGIGQAADVDNDGDYDFGMLARKGYIGPPTTLIKNNGNGTFTASELATAMEGGIEARNFIFRDIDNDGDQDFCATVEHFVYVFENKNGLFQKAYTSPRYNLVLQLAVEDFNHDGRPDLLFSHYNGDYVGNGYQLLLQGSSFSFAAASYHFIPEYSQLIGDFAVGDLNNDGFADILFGGSHVTNEKAKIFYNLKGNTFAAQETEIPSLGGFWLVDYNQDGNLDIIRSNSGGEDYLLVYEGKGNLQFNSEREITITNAQLSGVLDVQTADIDLNGQPDLLLSSRDRLTILQSQGDGNYFPTVLPYPYYWEDRLLITDLENDGDLDLYHEGFYNFYENKLRSTKSKPLPSIPVPTNISVKPGNQTKISWSPVPSNYPAPAISYNLIIKNAAGKIIMHSETNETGTFRRRLGPGNAGNQTSYSINNLPAGEYSVQVQTINASFQSSAFSKPQRFQILNGPQKLVVERILLNKVRLTWQEVITGETKIIVERRTADTDFSIIAQLPPNSITYTDAKLSYNKRYTYRVSALIKDQSSAGSNQVTWNTGLFALKQKPGLPSMVETKVEVADYNNDGRLDLSVFGNPTMESRKTGNIKIVENTKTGWISHSLNSNNITYTQELQFFDFNGDQQLDLFRFGSGSNYQNISELNSNKGNNQFQTEPSVFTNKPQSILGWWDIDSDNDLDAFTFEAGAAFPWPKRVFQNNGNGNFILKKKVLILVKDVVMGLYQMITTEMEMKTCCNTLTLMKAAQVITL